MDTGVVATEDALQEAASADKSGLVDKDWLIQMSCKVTEAFSKKYYPQEVANAKELTPKGKKIKKLLTSVDFGCKKEALSKLVSAIIGEDVAVLDDQYNAIHTPRLLMFKVTEAGINNYDFREHDRGKMFIKVDKTRAMRLKGDASGIVVKAYCESMAQSHFIPCTAEEIKATIKAISQQYIDEYLSDLEFFA